jgi:hypothetical protein
MNRYSKEELTEMLSKVVDELDKHLMKFAFQSKLNGMGNTWIYQQLKMKIEEQPKKLQPLLIQWLDNRWGDYKLY